jgi:ubiquinone/menaquinone biosynthesis C-methylase UbiE
MSAVYAGAFAQLYDACYAGKDYRGEAAWIADACTRITGSAPRCLLDVACGTGRHAEAFAAAGIDVVGIDRSADMLAIARRRLSSSRLVQADMTTLPNLIREASVDAAVCLFDSLGYAGSACGSATVLSGMARAVRPGGIVVVEVWNADAMAAFEPHRERRLASGEVRVSRTTIDASRRSAIVEWTLRRPGVPDCQERHQNLFFDAGELRGLMTVAGLHDVRIHGGFEQAQAVIAPFHLVATGRMPRRGGTSVAPPACSGEVRA